MAFFMNTETADVRRDSELQAAQLRIFLRTDTSEIPVSSPVLLCKSMFTTSYNIMHIVTQGRLRGIISFSPLNLF